MTRAGSNDSGSTRHFQFELCAETIQACLAASEGGANRIELCSALGEGGLTPSHAMIRQAVRTSGLPVYPILRPRGGDFVYTPAEFDVMVDDLLHARQLDASGFVVGLLDDAGAIDVVRTRQLVELAAPLEVTFHRAFDCTTDLPQALEDVVATGCKRLLTSGGALNVFEGAVMLAKLAEQAAGRLQVAVGGGLRLESAQEVARITQAKSFHGSVRRPFALHHSRVPGEEQSASWSVHAQDIRNMIDALRAGGSV